jgi:hypothetical protein
MLPRTFVWANDPGIRPASNFAKLISLIAIPPLFIIIPDKTKNGTANKAKLSSPVTIFCADVKTATSKGNKMIMVAIEAPAILIAIGTPVNSRTKNTTNKIIPAAKVISFNLLVF